MEKKLKVLLIGSGGREHALAWKLTQSPRLEKLYCAPGNVGISEIAECVDIKVGDIDGLLQFAKKERIDLTVVGPEIPLVGGIVDHFENAGLIIFGPSKAAAQLEGSKVFSKEFMLRCNIPTATFMPFDRIEDARAFLNHAQFPLVIKADGLAAGKGVVLCNALADGLEALDQMMKDKIFAEAGAKVVVEDYLIGEEVSILAFCDGENYLILESAQDHKRIFDDDLGPNTGGMGAYSPAPIVTETLLRKIEARVIEPTVRGMAREGMPFKGILYAGLMITSQGPQVLEYNVRFGDPETQAVLPRLESDLLEVMLASCEGRLNEIQLKWTPKSCVCVVMSSGGYPGKYENGYEINGLNVAADGKNTYVFHAGTKKDGDRVVTAGGRVLGVVSLGDHIKDAIQSVYVAVEKIKFDHMFFRRDIAAKALKKDHIKSANAVGR
ncbi:MAG: phosphoribosylamine--glycine ligase [Candidatus Omnitrophica bacterium]|nr:phosphoribosylamine--glycine ligase [Candidatus Omnitrophota bacterium]